MKSAEEKKKYGTYKAPPGYTWEDVSTTKRPKFELVPTVPVTYQTWTYLDNAFQLYDAHTNSYHSINDFSWLTPELKNKPRATTDFVKDTLNDEFNLRIDTTHISKKQRKEITNFFNTKESRMGDNFKYTYQPGFFQATYQKAQTSGKIKRNEIYRVAEDIVSTLNTIMAP